ncbi:MAG: alpha-amylase family glycosyl hydrolase [Ignavibacteria bacterium]|nr:alpha-amylase family glycosyl hydrolase [Ignavibacteria bacterium]
MNKHPKYFFHISKDARDKYQFEDEFYSIRGNLIVADGKAARLLTEKINQLRTAEGRTDQLVSVGQVNTLGLLHEIFHFLIRYYEDKENPGVFARGVNHLKNNLTETDLNSVLSEYVNHFPPLDVNKGKISAGDFITGTTDGKSNKEIILEEIILLHLENNNPAANQLEELYSEKSLIEKTKYSEFIDQTEKFFSNEKPIGPDNLPLIHFLRKPLIESPYNLDGQLDYILTNWEIFIYDKFGNRLLKGKDIVFEDSKLFLHYMGGKGTPPVPSYEFDKDYFARLKAKLGEGGKLTFEESTYYEEYERFSQDIDWMPNVIMIAKNAFVWLDQLSKKHHREINRLDQIPNEELDRLAQWNFTALWLIGIWERSSASGKIKQMMGNPEAASSAYSLYDYIIANELGGEEAFQNLKHRTWQRGIRLASDMVPNHTGIHSRWVVEKPHYFIQSNYPPYPGYRFTGPNLSDDPRVEVRIEDKYYNMSDAAVVFERRDSYTGDTKYIYHGNDGTHMPWNDTAQLNLLNPEVREALYQRIKHVASKTSIIRFDAAMTLTKKHYQRLWFPQPGHGGAIPSRSDFGMTKEEFDKAMPEEFWREVVDRMKREMPETLLLAEAFWLMEGYFVRTLGMHRVYNSAFMHMMMKEENEKYKLLIKNTLDFNPEILKRYVNFMSNPDEETAVNQFGKGDKYFGVAVMMVTLPGLPMFGHGQVEGFSEKYGMEYKRAYYNEFIDENLVSRHEHEIFPLLRKRYLFSQVENFELYDFYENSGIVNENVFAFTNRRGDERTLVIYNNSYTECKGTINWSVPKVYSTGGNPSIKKLSEALVLKNEERIYYSYRDYKTKFQHLISSVDIHNSGFYISLNGYDYRVCLDFKEIYDFDGSWERLYHHLGGRGVYSLEQELKEHQLYPLHESIIDFLNPEFVDKVKSQFISEDDVKKKNKPELRNKIEPGLKDEIDKKLDNVLTHLNSIYPVPFDNVKIKAGVVSDIESIIKINKMLNTLRNEKEKEYNKIKDSLIYEDGNNQENSWAVLLSLILFNRILNSNGKEENLFDNLIIGKALNTSFSIITPNNEETGNDIFLVKLLTAKDKSKLWDKSAKRVNMESKGRKTESALNEKDFLNKLLDGDDAKWYIGLNEYKGTKYYNKGKLDKLLNWIFSLKILTQINNKDSRNDPDFRREKAKTVKKKQPVKKTVLHSNSEVQIKNILKDYKFFEKIKKASDDSGYKLDELLSSFEKPKANLEKPKTKEKIKAAKHVKKTTKKSLSKKEIKKSPNTD